MGTVRLAWSERSEIFFKSGKTQNNKVIPVYCYFIGNGIHSFQIHVSREIDILMIEASLLLTVAVFCKKKIPIGAIFFPFKILSIDGSRKK